MKGLYDLAAEQLRKVQAFQREREKIAIMEEKSAVTTKYDHYQKAYTYKDPVRLEIEDVWVNLGKRLNENLDKVNGINEELILKVWSLSKLEMDSIISALKAHTKQVEVYETRIYNCANLSEAAPLACQLDIYHRQEMDKLNIIASQFIQKCVNKATELILHVEVPQQSAAASAPIDSAENADLLQQLLEIKAKNDELKEKLAQQAEASLQKDTLISTMAQMFEMYQATLVQANSTIADKDANIAEYKVIIADKDANIIEQKVTITDLREDKKTLKEKVDEQKVQIESLTESNLGQVEKIQKVTVKYLDLKTHFSDLVTLHQQLDNDYTPLIELNDEDQ